MINCSGLGRTACHFFMYARTEENDNKLNLESRRHWLFCSALINEECFLWMNKLGKHICWKICGFMAVCYYVDSSQHFSVVWCCFQLANLVIAGVHWRNQSCPCCISATGNVFIKTRLQIFNQLSGPPRVIPGQTKPQRVGPLYITWQEMRNDVSPLSSGGLAVLSSTDWFVCFSYLNAA